MFFGGRRPLRWAFIHNDQVLHRRPRAAVRVKARFFWQNPEPTNIFQRHGFESIIPYCWLTSNGERETKMSPSVVLPFSALPDVLPSAVPPGTPETIAQPTSGRKRITIKHPSVKAWTQANNGLRISLRFTYNHDTALPPVIIPVAAISGPFFDGADC